LKRRTADKRTQTWTRLQIAVTTAAKPSSKSIRR
jgi:hypothetical protein